MSSGCHCLLSQHLRSRWSPATQTQRGALSPLIPPVLGRPVNRENTHLLPVRALELLDLSLRGRMTPFKMFNTEHIKPWWKRAVKFPADEVNKWTGSTCRRSWHKPQDQEEVSAGNICLPDVDLPNDLPKHAQPRQQFCLLHLVPRKSSLSNCTY